MNLLHIPRGIAGIAVIGDIGLGPVSCSCWPMKCSSQERANLIVM